MTELVTISLGERSYEILIGQGAWSIAQRLAAVSPERRYAVLADANVLRLHKDFVETGLGHLQIAGAPIEIPEGETAKSFGMLEIVLSQLLERALERGDAIIAIGGGVTGDLAGFAAAIYKRGIDVIQVPTTLLAMADSSVGGKTAINMPQGKNLVGAFHQPRLVVADFAFLDTLPKRQLLAGYAEIIKAALIGDADFFDQLEYSNRDSLTALHLQAHLKTAIQFKADIVEADEREAGQRALLNFGHTFGHALESDAKGALLHGEAVAAGMALAFDYSVRLGICPENDARRVKDYLKLVGLETGLGSLPGAPFTAEAMVERMRHDKKNAGGAIRLVLARGIGNAFIHEVADEADLLNFLKDKIQ
ncbi:3-dehydroquinate synthase [Hyphobacterium sp. HN65]|uniref:3-dehydroquinate synthase n=1 Tax=Hyphobacterium lacteum TaxID=3116575 RepID=A0ABU7LQ65_9PROT|nr:3-dehydroquinate synthase [Hyphobacterium sp. HN65]MEE2526058.1 3-dehydroquinate synthase [Hyphobacterium sp. HN65]